MSLERAEWLERKGVVDVGMYEYAGQNDTHVFLVRRDIGLRINRKKDMKGWRF